ncbi:cation transporter [Pullulanibacillus sp. KACC 23026]|uniref:heavy-metal-associated domain-containing protein n=1 Tax=Pullulanibacillus sp. KACC 23026 TaxID=3028315 RepID=UPI0023B15769|nr:cation transporter [Pullulanibacillus sp. KACC 23026]WEG12050.1 cation transporter [Pullulanibacillus sp. KACC 23026]
MEVIRSIKVKDLQDEKADEVSRILYDVWGIRNVEVNVDTSEAVVSFNEDSASLEDFEQALMDSGYQIEI